MPKNLVIVESPAKARTIERYLGADYRVLASYGHVRDLPENPGKGKFGVDVDHDFEPEYVISEDRRKQVTEITKAAKSADMVFLATDLDREGEAIAWHVAEAAHVAGDKQQRVTFNEITESAIQEAFAHPRQIDMDLVDAQQTRRIVDRLVGYTLSPLLGKKVQRGLSAGRVQSVAVRLVVEREREIRAFTAREYWTIQAILATAAGETFAAELVRIDGEALDIPDEATSDAHAAAIRELHPVVTKLGTRTQKRSPAAPFTTSTLQQEASRRLGFSPKRTMSVAQRLYEGIETPEGQVGLITYMRTDSTAIAGVAMGEAREVIGSRYGETYTMPKGRVYKTKSKGAQEAHESIRPTSFKRDPDAMADLLKSDEARLYRLIWQRALASQMAPKELETTTIELADGRYELRASATKVLFDGFSIVYTEGRDDAASDDEDEAGARLPNLTEGSVTDVNDVTPTQHFTEPPPRFTEATLIKALEEHGIGRPSTYAATISTITDRGYVRVEERRLHPEPVAEIVTDFLVEHFGAYVDVEFTARMEEELDEVATGERPWVPMLRAFYDQLKRRHRQGSGWPRTRGDRRGLLARPPDGHQARTERAIPRLLAVSGAQGDPAGAGRRAAAPGGHRRGLPGVRAGHARQQDRPVRAVRRLLALPRVQVHQEGRPAAARSAAVRGRLPEEQGRPPRAASRATHRERLLGMLQLPALRLHDEPRAAGRPPRHRRRAAGPQGRWGPVPGLRIRPAMPRRPTSSRVRSIRAGRRTRRRWHGRLARAVAHGVAEPRRPVDARAVAPVAAAPRRGERARSSRPPTRERGLGRDRDRPVSRTVPSITRRAGRLAAHPARVPDRGRRLPRVARRTRHGLADAVAGGPAGLPRRAR